MPHTYRQPPPPDATALTIPQAAARLGISVSTMRRLIDAGDIPTALIGQRLRRIPVAALDAYIAREAS